MSLRSSRGREQSCCCVPRQLCLTENVSLRPIRAAATSNDPGACKSRLALMRRPRSFVSSEEQSGGVYWPQRRQSEAPQEACNVRLSGEEALSWKRSQRNQNTSALTEDGFTPSSWETAQEAARLNIATLRDGGAMETLQGLVPMTTSSI